MGVALAALALGAVAFLLRVLFARVREGMRVSHPTAKVYFARFNPSPTRKDLMVMTPEAPPRQHSRRTGQRIAL
jgi:hypothetical protein